MIFALVRNPVGLNDVMLATKVFFCRLSITSSNFGGDDFYNLEVTGVYTYNFHIDVYNELKVSGTLNLTSSGKTINVNGASANLKVTGTGQIGGSQYILIQMLSSGYVAQMDGWINWY